MGHWMKARHCWLAWLLIWTMAGTTIVPYASAQPTETVQFAGKSGEAVLQDALRLYEELEWERAIERFKVALDSEIGADARAKAYWYLAILSYAYDDLQKIEDYMYRAFRAKPSFDPPEPVRGRVLEEIFNRVSGRIDRLPPEVKILPTKGVKLNQPIHVAVEISDNSPIVQVELFYQLSDAKSETVVPMKLEAGNRWSADIPNTATKTAGKFPFRVSVQDEWQNITTQSGTVGISKEGGGRGIFYVIGGAIVAIGGGVAALVLSSSGDDTTPTDSSPEDTWPKSGSPLPPE